MARVFTRQRTWLDPLLRPLERADLPADRRGRVARDALDRVRRLACCCSASCRCWCSTRCSACQGVLPFNPQGFGAVAPALAFNTAASFATNTNWQAYGGETTMSYFTQMAGLAYQNFVSAAAGIAVAIAFIRGIARQETDTLGNFWVDMVRASLWMLLPICDRRRAVPRLAGRRPEPEAVRQRAGHRSSDDHATDAAGKVQQTVVRSRRSRRGRSPRRKSSSSSAPTAAASSTPTAPTRSRTRRRSPTSSRCSGSSRSPPG